jgi:hypothetical protein
LVSLPYAKIHPAKAKNQVLNRLEEQSTTEWSPNQRSAPSAYPISPREISLLKPLTPVMEASG